MEEFKDEKKPLLIYIWGQDNDTFILMEHIFKTDYERYYTRKDNQNDYLERKT